MSANGNKKSRSNQKCRFSDVRGSNLGSCSVVILKNQSPDPKISILPQALKLESCISHTLTIRSLTTLIIIYSILAIIRITFESETQPINFQLDILELVFLSIFITELFLRIIVYKSLYFKYCWNIFDLLIIAICLLIIIGSLSQSAIAHTQAYKLGKIMRIFRLFIVSRKMTTMYKFRKKVINKKVSVANVSSPSEKVVEILTNLQQIEWISYQKDLKSDLEWCILMIKEQRIYQTSVRLEKEELFNLVNWAANEVHQEDPDTTIKFQNYIKIVTLDKFEPDTDKILAGCHNWDFDIFNLERISNSHVLEVMISHLFSLYNLYHTLSLDNQKLNNFIKTVESGYHKENPYHNAIHAADVVQCFYYFFSTCKAMHICSLTDLDIAICLLSSAAHDYDHPGYNNLFLINSSHPLALTYNDRSVLENHHSASVFKLMHEEKNNFLINASKDDKKKFRFKMISLILATDFSRHFVDLNKFKLKFTDGLIKNDEDKLEVMEMIMHTADVSNPSRHWKTCFEWANRLMAEFISQGDKEKELGLPVSNLCDRYAINIPESQICFIELFIEPTFNALKMILPAVSENIKIIIDNKEEWRERQDDNLFKL